MQDLERIGQNRIGRIAELQDRQDIEQNGIGLKNLFNQCHFSILLLFCSLSCLILPLCDPAYPVLFCSTIAPILFYILHILFPHSIFQKILLSFLLCSFSLLALIPEDVKIIPHSQNREDKRKAKLAICCIFQDEGKYLKEWIEYHSLVGVSHFYLYNNCSKDNYREVLAPYISKGIIELFDVPFNSNAIRDGAKTHNFVQVCCYNHALKLSKGKNRWLAIIDSDEFICPVKEDSLLSVLKKYEYAPGLVVYWQIYGTSNVWKLNPNELLLEKLTWKAPRNYPPNILVKSIVNPKYATCKNPHTCRYSHNRFAVTPLHKRFTHTKKIECPPVDVIRINHYTYRTLSYYYNVKKPRRSRWGTNYPPDMEKSLLEQTNSVHDPVMERFVPLLKKRMGLRP